MIAKAVLCGIEAFLWAVAIIAIARYTPHGKRYDCAEKECECCPFPCENHKTERN